MSVIEMLGVAEDTTQRIEGVVNALVTETNDPEKLGRVKLRYPLLGNVTTDWVRVCSFYSGKNRGAFFQPAKDDEVLVAFGQGNINQPYVIGCLWNGVDQPPVPAKDMQKVREIKTASGQVIRFEEQSNERITITDAKKNQIIIDTKKGSITVQCEKNLEVISAKGTVTVKGTNVKVDAKSKLSLSGSSIDIKAKGTLTLKGTRINLN